MLASEKIADYLEVKRGDAVLRLRQISYFEDGTPFEYVRTQYVGNRFEFYLENKTGDPDSLLRNKENQNHLFYMISYQLLVIRNRTLFKLDLSVQQLNDGFFKVVSTFHLQHR